MLRLKCCIPSHYVNSLHASGYTARASSIITRKVVTETDSKQDISDKQKNQQLQTGEKAKLIVLSLASLYNLKRTPSIVCVRCDLAMQVAK